MTKHTSLYFLYDNADRLLYVGISSRGPARWKDHQQDKQWWSDVSYARVLHFRDRRDALYAEKTAIENLRPRWNIAHNDAHDVAISSPCSRTASGIYKFFYWDTRKPGLGPDDQIRITRLHLYAELDGSSLVVDSQFGSLSASEELEVFVQYLDKHGIEEVKLVWFVVGHGVFERAPSASWDGPYDFSSNDRAMGNFLDYFTWPLDVATGEPIDWSTLPVELGCGQLGEAIKWKPSPMQESCPLRKILNGRKTARENAHVTKVLEGMLPLKAMAS